jgi:hypothetical protein
MHDDQYVRPTQWAELEADYRRGVDLRRKDSDGRPLEAFSPDEYLRRRVAREAHDRRLGDQVIADLAALEASQKKSLRRKG